MEAEKHNNSDTSSAESDNQQEKPSKDNAARVGRSYECTFCKRGFTNAQALGGHMNIHRKDKAKAKANQKNQEDPLISNFKSNEKYQNLSYFPQSSSDGCNPLGAHVNYEVYLPSYNPSFQTGNYQYNYFPVWRPDHLKDHMDANLSLRVGLRPPVENEEEVDLELRLGQYP